MAQMQPENGHCKEIPRGDCRILKTVYDHREHVAAPRRVEVAEVARANHPKGQVQQVINDKRLDKQSTQEHVAGGETGLHGCLDEVCPRSGVAVLKIQLDARINVDPKNQQ